MSIKVNNLTYTYMKDTPFESTAVKDVSFEISNGEFIGIIGHTGSGKSTLIQQLNGLLLPTAGTVTVDGIELGKDKQSLKTIRSKIGIVFQYPEYQLFEETVEKDVAYGPKNMGLSECEIKERVKNAIEDIGLDYDEIKDCSPFGLSGGQKRRVAIAGVLAMNPDIIIFDEPTAGLDPQGRELLFEQIKKIHKKGKTVILVSHNMDDIARMADRIFVMSAGQLVFTGTPKEVFSQKSEEFSLDIPQLEKLARVLNETGKFNLPSGIFEIEEMKNNILKSLEADKNV